MEPRVVLVTRAGPWEELVARHGTAGQARWFLAQRGLAAEGLIAKDQRLEATLAEVEASLPGSWGTTRVRREALDRFLFEPRDLVVVIGQDGLVPNVAKYVGEQPVLGLRPDPDGPPGLLARHDPRRAGPLLRQLAAGRCPVRQLTLVRARTDDGQELHALNEVFLGHRTHQSALYTLQHGGARAPHSSSGLLCATGTGSTGWASSLHRATRSALPLPAPTDPRLIWFVREPWVSAHSTAELAEGLLDGDDGLTFTSRMEDGVLFGDGMERDAIPLPYGRQVVIQRSPRTLRLA